MANSSGNLEVAYLLLDAGSDVNAVDYWGRTPLYWAIFSEKHVLSKLFLDRGARLDLVKSLPIPEWATAFVACRNACRSSCYAMLELARRRSNVIGGNRRDVLGLIARLVWASRREELWERKNSKKVKP
jgi:ankyrin repeat protein